MSTAKDRFIAALVLQLGVLDSKWSLVDFVSIVNAALADTGTRIVDEADDIKGIETVALAFEEG